MEQLSEMLFLDFFFLSKMCLIEVCDDQENPIDVCEELKKPDKDSNPV